MAVLAHCERGLIIDVFGDKPKIIKSDTYVQNNNQLVSVFNSKLKFIDLLNLKNEKEISLPGFSEMKQSNNGENIAVLCNNQLLQIFKKKEIINEISDVEEFAISDNFYCYSSKGVVKIFSFTENKLMYTGSVLVKTFHCLNSCILIVTEKSETQKILLFKDSKMKILMDLPQIFRTVVKTDNNEKNILLLASLEYTKSSYYADSTLFLIKFDSLDQLKINAAESEIKDSGVPEIKIVNDIFGIISFNKLNKVHDFGFINDKIYVCFGDQPAYLHIYSLLAVFLKKMPKTVRNTIAFNKSGNKVINSGFGNLPGNIEVYCNERSTCYFESLGASYALWMNDDSRFMVATTNYFKTDNKICIYDYYGRLLEIMKCNSLISATVYGLPEKEVTFAAPKEITSQKPAVAYVPPHLQSKTPIPNATNKKSSKAKASPEQKVRTKEQVEKELSTCLKLREKLRKGDELSLDDENRVFSIKILQEELEKLSSK